MGIHTSDFIPNLPPKDLNSLTEAEIAVGFDWLGILDSFDPSQLEPRFLNECARRNPYYTCYDRDVDGIPHSPVEERLSYFEPCYRDMYRRELSDLANYIKEHGLNRINYNKARASLIKCIGMKGALECVRWEYERLGTEGRKRQKEAYNTFERERQEKRKIQEREGQEYDDAIRAAVRSSENGNFERGRFFSI